MNLNSSIFIKILNLKIMKRNIAVFFAIVMIALTSLVSCNKEENVVPIFASVELSTDNKTVL